MTARLLLDACVAINLIATQKFDEIAAANDLVFVMVSEAAQEVSSLRDYVDGERVIVPINVAERLRSGALEFTELAEDEFPLYVQYAAKVDDGEAATIAAAVARSWPLATDDRAGRRLCDEIGVSRLISTSLLLRKYAESDELTPKEISRLLQRIEKHASFVSGRTDSNYNWWMEHLRLEE